MDRFSLLKVILLSALAAGCQKLSSPTLASMDNFPVVPEYTEFQWAVINQGQLIIVEHQGVYWPTYRADSGLLESNPPKVRLQRYGDDKILVKTVTNLKSPMSLSSEKYVAQFKKDNDWVDSKDFKLEISQFQVLTENGWTFVENQSIRFKKKD